MWALCVATNLTVSALADTTTNNANRQSKLETALKLAAGDGRNRLKPKRGLNDEGVFMGMIGNPSLTHHNFMAGARVAENWLLLEFIGKAECQTERGASSVHAPRD